MSNITNIYNISECTIFDFAIIDILCWKFKTRYTTIWISSVEMQLYWYIIWLEHAKHKCLWKLSVILIYWSCWTGRVGEREEELILHFIHVQCKELDLLYLKYKN